ncbi:MAG: hypothetical protein ACO3JL_18470, partial [Myxococcota bacterium]
MNLRPCLVAFVLFFGSTTSWAAQIVTLDLKATGGVPPRLAKSLSPVLVAELARREGMSVVSQDDVRALLELEADKAMLGCSDTGCMTELAGSLGAELLCTSTLGRVGGEYVVTTTLIQVEGAKVLRRSTGKAKGGEEAATEAVLQAVLDLFKEGLPSTVQGPASMTRRGFEAALAGMHGAILDRTGDPRESRRRIILDLVATELDYDATPKLDMLDLALRRGRAEAYRRVLAARDLDERNFYVRAMDHYGAFFDDLGRVKEIRTRARERGLVPSSSALRFLEPDPGKEPDPVLVNRYQETASAGHKLIAKALTAAEQNNVDAFAGCFKQGYETTAKKQLESLKQERERGVRYELL